MILERTIPKSETVFIPVSEDERSPRRRQPRATLQHTSPGQIHRKPFTGAHYDPLQLPDYISPYAYYPSKPYFERTLHPNSLPVLRNNSSKRKSRPTQYEPRHRVERKQPYDPWIPHSLVNILIFFLYLFYFLVNRRDILSSRNKLLVYGIMKMKRRQIMMTIWMN